MYCKDCKDNDNGVCYQVGKQEDEGYAWINEQWESNSDLRVSDTFGCIKFKKKITKIPK